jgi:hypothetical protein
MKKIQSSLVLFAFVLSSFALSGCFLDKAPETPPQDVVKEGMQNFSKIKSGVYEISLKGAAVGAEGVTPKNVGFDVKFGGVFDGNDAKHPLFSLKADGNVTVDEQKPQLLNAELRINKENLYAFIQNVPNFDNAIPSELIAMFASKWWQVAIPEGTFEKIKLPTTAVDEANLTPEEKQIKELINNTNFFTNITYDGNEKIAGENCYRYTASLDKKAINDFSVKVSEIQKTQITPEQVAQLNAFLDTANMPAKIWVAKSDNTMRKVEGTLQLKPANAGSIDITFSFTASDLNKAVTIEVPKDAVKFDPSVFTGLGGAASATGTPDASGALPEGALDTSGLEGLELPATEIPVSIAE